jgi:hypothetical protein
MIGRAAVVREGNLIYIFGGNASGDSEVWNTVTNESLSLPSLGHERYDACCVLLSSIGHILIGGGRQSVLMTASPSPPSSLTHHSAYGGVPSKSKPTTRLSTFLVFDIHHKCYHKVIIEFPSEGIIVGYHSFIHLLGHDHYDPHDAEGKPLKKPKGTPKGGPPPLPSKDGEIILIDDDNKESIGTPNVLFFFCPSS